MVFPTSSCVNVMDEPVSPLLHVYVIVPIPSISAILFDAVNTSPCLGVPEMVTDPVRGSFTFTTISVALLVTLSAYLSPSV